MGSYNKKVNEILNQVNSVVKGKNEVVEKVFTAILAKGHILLEDYPGVGKTTLALAFSKAMDLEYHRLQFTPDVLPTDVVGFHMISKDGDPDQYRAGAVLCNLFLADEINRTSAKTQSALLEVMEEGKVTVDGITREVPRPFVVLATQNPLGSVGTQPLPESQLDRFMIRLTMGYPDIRDEIAILKERQGLNPLEQVYQVINKQDILQMQQQVNQVYVHDTIYAYISLLVHQTRDHEMIELGVSPRGSIALMNMVKANAFIHDRDYVTPDDVRYLFQDVIAHRMILNPKARVHHISTKDLIDDIIKNVKPPNLIKR